MYKLHLLLRLIHIPDRLKLYCLYERSMFFEVTRSNYVADEERADEERVVINYVEADLIVTDDRTV